MVAGTAIADRAQAWADVYLQLRPTLVRALAASVGTYEGVEDAIQEAFASALTRDIAEFRSPEAWLYTVALNRLRKQHRRAALAAKMRLRPQPQPHDLDNSLRRADLMSRLLALPARDRELLIAKHYVGMTQDEIAAYLKVPRGTVAAAISRAAARFRGSETAR